MKKTMVKKIFLGLTLFSVILGSFNFQPRQAHAIPVVVTNPIIIAGNISPTEIQNTALNLEQRIKNYVLDGLAWRIAKMIVQRITASVVTWINSGFSGSPSFLSNPGGFFANVGDQVTGNFIANTGILAGLCSPFNVDIRLSLALGQAGYGQVEKYTCTLNSVISNVKNSTVNGATIEGFMKGDFKQGGWPAFIEISRPNNNASGAYLKAQSDLNQKIGSKQGTVNQQLLQGSGFLSWESCKNITPQQAGAASDSAIFASNQIDSSFGNQKVVTDPGKAAGGQTSIQKNVDSKTGLVSYQDCVTQTPGSVINGQLTHVLGSGVDQLNLADSINEIVDALLGQLVNKILQTGLGAVSSKPSGITQSYIEQLSAATNSTTTYAQDAQNIENTFSTYINNAQTIKDLRQQGLDYFKIALAEYTFAQTCFSNISFASLNKPLADTALVGIENELKQFYTSQKPYLDKFITATNALTTIQEQSKLASTVGSLESLEKASLALQQITSTQSPIADTEGPTDDAKEAKKIAGKYENQAQGYQQQCRALGGN